MTFPDGGGWTNGDMRFHEVFNRNCGAWIGLFQAGATKRELRDGHIAHASRLDRIYSCSPAAVIADITVHASVIGKLCHARTSDHIPVLAHIQAYHPPVGANGIIP
eukprot:8162934-Pyramimonas_sp.AAC.1